jgi:hypothetical protein
VLALHVHRTNAGERFFMAVVASGRKGLRKPTLTIAGVETENVYPRSLRSIRAGRQVLVFGRILGAGSPVATLTGSTRDLPLGLTAKPSRRGSIARSNAFIAGLWAQGRIDEIRRKSGGGALSKKSREEIVALATRYGILTPQTAILAR